MVECVYKGRKRLTDEERAERKATEKERQRLRQEKEKAWLKAHKIKKVPLTKEEKEQKRLDQVKEEKDKETENAKKVYIPLTRMDVMAKIRKIDRYGGLEELVSKTGIQEHWFKGWIHSNRRPEGKYLTDLQEYFGKTT